MALMYKDRPAPKPTTATCPNCQQEVSLEVLQGRVRKVTTTVLHISNKRICYAILKTEETR